MQKKIWDFKMIELQFLCIIFLLQQMTNSEGIKYICGCGKQYSSYPAFSTHKRLKHNNQEINGTTIPKTLVPKRGRPSFSRPTKKQTNKQTYSALTVVQTALLKLQELYTPILTQPQSQPDFTILNLYDDCEKSVINEVGAALVEAIKNFNQTVINHTNSSMSTSLTQYFVELTSYFLENMSAKSIKLQWEQEKKQSDKLSTCLFNRFFNNRVKRQNTQQHGINCNKPFELFLSMTVTLSQYLYKLGMTEAILKMRG